MSKFTAPDVTFADVMAALPAISSKSLSFKCTIVSPSFGDADLFVCVELNYFNGSGRGGVWQRWGRKVPRGRPKAILGVMLIAAQEAYLWSQGKDWGELEKLAAWQLGVPS